MNYQKIKTWEDACKVLDISPELLPHVSMLREEDQAPIIAHYKLIKIAEALNAGWRPDWNDDDQYKYYTWFEIDADDENTSGFGFSDTLYDYWSTFTDVGSRLCFSSRELALYAGKQFKELYLEYFLFKK